ncbi:MAG: Mur ligase family protein [Ginsengibacter sp.]
MKVHFIAIGGSVMHQLAISLVHKGYIVSGSDDEIFEPATSNLKNAGILPIDEGWFASKITPHLDAIILGMHARADNVELIKAKELNLKIYSFPEYIFNESKDTIRVAVGGSHGKTTTTSMIMHVLQKCHKNFDFMVGAKLEGFQNSVQISSAPVIICEADEYPASAIEKRPKFHFLFPHIAVLTGIAWDHINVFPTFEFYKEQFKIFISKIEKNGVLIYNGTDTVLKELVESVKRNDLQYLPYGIPKHTIKNGITTISIESTEGQISVFGNHNLMNIQAAYHVCNNLGISAADFVKAIAAFTGASKRLEVLYTDEQCNIYRDFAHAPSKVKASIEAVKSQFPSRKLMALLELHTYSSLNEAFMSEYLNSFEPADESAVFYSAHALAIKKMPDLDPQTVEKGFNKSGLKVFNKKEDLEKWLEERDLKNSSLLLMSSGTFDGIDILKTLNKVKVSS